MASESQTAALTLEVDKSHSQVKELASKAASLEADLSKAKVDLRTLTLEKDELVNEVRIITLARDDADQQSAALRDKLDKLEAKHNEALDAHRAKVSDLVASS